MGTVWYTVVHRGTNSWKGHSCRWSSKNSSRWWKTGYGILAQLGEHLPYKQRVIGSSPIGPICRSGGTGRRPGLKIPWVVIPVPVRFRSAAWPETLDFQGFFWCLDIFTPFWNTSYLTPKWILTSDLTADTKYLSSFKIIFWYNIHFFYSWKLEFPCLIVSKVARAKIKVK